MIWKTQLSTNFTFQSTMHFQQCPKVMKSNWPQFSSANILKMTSDRVWFCCWGHTWIIRIKYPNQCPWQQEFKPSLEGPIINCFIRPEWMSIHFASWCKLLLVFYFCISWSKITGFIMQITTGFLFLYHEAKLLVVAFLMVATRKPQPQLYYI